MMLPILWGHRPEKDQLKNVRYYLNSRRVSWKNIELKYGDNLIMTFTWYLK